MNNRSAGSIQPLPIILASTSTYRAELLNRLQLEYQAIPPEFEETVQPGALLKEVARDFAEAKAKSLRHRFPNHLIIGSDQAAILDQTLLDKPVSRSRAIEKLQQCSNQIVIFYTGLAVLNTQTQALRTACETTTVRFRPLSLSQIQNYLDKEEVLDCCGSFKIEGLGISLMQSVESTDPTALMGLPLIALCRLLKQEGLNVP